MNQNLGFQNSSMEEGNWAALAGDYHNGPLSVIIPFGIWGVIAFVWFVVASLRVLYRNYKYCDPSLRIINAFLFAAFLTRIIIFTIVYGAFDGDMRFLVGYVGFSVCLNRGVCRRPSEAEQRAAQAKENVAAIPQFAPAFQRTRYRS